MGNISRDGAPKKTQTKFDAATPPHVVKLGDNVSVPIPGLSRTESSKLFDGDKLGTVNDGGESVFVRHDTVDLGARLDDARPADHGGDAVATFPR